MAHSLVNDVPVSVPVEDPVDRAHRKRKLGGQMRVGPRKIGFWPDNRGGKGISSKHVHEVAADFLKNKVRLDRYDPVQLLEVPEPLLKKIKRVNKERCDADPQLPSYCDEMMYIPATKTHFSCACRMALDGTHRLFNQPDGPPIRFRSDDSEGYNIANNGVAAVIFESSIWDDMEAVHALSVQGNFNSAIDAGEDEMQAFGRVSALMERMSKYPEWQGKNIPAAAIVTEIENSNGLAHWSREDWKHLISLRTSLPLQHASILMNCQFNMDGGTKLKAWNYYQVSKIDSRHPWVKVALMLYAYTESSDAKVQKKVTFDFQKDAYGRDLSLPILQQLQQEVQIQKSFEKAMRATLRHYAEPDYQASGNCESKAATSLQAARGDYLAKAGKAIMRVLQPLKEAVHEATKNKVQLTPQQREKLIQDMKLEKEEIELETKFRTMLLEHNVYTEETMPQRVLKKKVNEEAETEEAEKIIRSKDKEKAAEVIQPLTSDCMMGGIESCLELTNQDVFDRLAIPGLGEMIMASIHVDEDDCVETTIVKEEPISDNECDEDGAQRRVYHEWFEAKLRRLELPWAHVQVAEVTNEYVQGEASGRTMVTRNKVFRVHERQLRAREPDVDTPKEPHPTLQDQGDLLCEQNWEDAEVDYKLKTIDALLADLVVQTRPSAARVEVSRQSKPGKAPLTLQCRVKEDCKAEELVLVPGNAVVQIITADREDGQGKKKKEVLHPSMLPKVQGCIQESLKDRRFREFSQPHDNKQRLFDLTSPLFSKTLKKGGDLEPQDVPPYWAVLKCIKAQSVHNMEFVEKTVVLPHAWFKGLPASTLTTTISIPVLTNCVPLEKGDVLTMPKRHPLYGED